MRNTIFKCPICGSTHFKHSFPKDKSIPVFLAWCVKCGRYECWIKKEDYANWRYADKNIYMKNDVKLSEYAKNQLKIHKLLLQVGFKLNQNNKMLYTLVKNGLKYTVNLDVKRVKIKNLETNETKDYPLDSLITKLTQIINNV